MKIIRYFFVVLLPFSFASAESDDIPRTAEGKPDFTGTYDIKTMTPMDRPREMGDRKFMSKEEVQGWIRAKAAGRQADDARVLDPDREAPPDGGDGSAGPAGNVGGYNYFWIDEGDTPNAINGEYRTSIIYYPENGRRPGITAEARQRLGKIYRGFGPNTGKATWIDWDGPGPYDDPELLTHADRCLLGFSSTGGPPMLPALYNNMHRIVQGPDTLMVLIEMVHDARIIRIGGEHLPDDVRKWLGDSIGWWEGDTLVVETTNFNDTPALQPATRNLRVEERFSRLDDKTLLYNFKVEDPATWQDRWEGEYAWPESNERLYEYACHEGNYSMGNILRGARRLEREAMEERAGSDRGI